MDVYSSIILYMHFVKDILCDVKYISQSRLTMPLFPPGSQNNFTILCFVCFVFACRLLLGFISYICSSGPYMHVTSKSSIFLVLANVLIMFVFIL